MDDLSDEKKRSIDEVMADTTPGAVITTVGREYRYQADYSLNGRMYHIRCDDWKDFMDSCKNMEEKYIDGVATILPTVTPPGVSTAEVCKTCGMPTLPEIKITAKDGRMWWVRNCTSGDKTHKGPIRPAS